MDFKYSINDGETGLSPINLIKPTTKGYISTIIFLKREAIELLANPFLKFTVRNIAVKNKEEKTMQYTRLILTI